MTLPNAHDPTKPQMARLEEENARLRRELRDAEELLGKIFHASSNIMAIHTVRDGRFVDINEACASLGGFKREELIGRTMEEFNLLADPELEEKIEKKRSAEGKVRNIESRIRTRDGEIRTVLFSADPVTVNNEPCILAVSVDITEREKEATALRQSEEKYRTLVENSLLGLAIFQDGRFVFCNGSFADMLGFSIDELLHMSSAECAARVHPEDSPKIVDRQQRFLSGAPVPPRYEFRAFRRDGTEIFVEASSSVINFNGKSAMQSVYLDITDRKKAERALEESREYLNHIINCIGDPIMVKDREHRLLLVNDAFCKFTKIPREELIGTTALENFSPEIQQVFLKNEELLFETGREQHTEDVIQDRDGRSYTVMTRKSPLRDKDGNMQMIIAVRDISEYKRLEAQFLQAQKMEAIGVLAGGVAHDFNNLLNVINGYSELILEDLPPDDLLNQDLRQIHDAGLRAAALTSQLLDFGRKQILKPVTMDLNAVIADMNSMLRRLIGENIELVFHPQPSPAKIHADPAKIQQVVLNLVVNARDAMLQGGRITVETATVRFAEPSIREHGIAEAGAYIMLAIHDNGVGIDASTRSRIFEPFFTTKPKGKGTGLGLSTIYGIVKQSNGVIDIDSEPGKGTNFTICFPFAESAEAAAPPDAVAGRGSRGMETVLLVEDEEAVRSLASRILTARGYHVLEAEDGVAALRLSREYSGDIHLLLSDVIMPGMGGRSLVSRISESRPGIRVLLISGYTDSALSAEDAFEAGTTFLQKPFPVDALAARVREALDS